MKKVFHINIDIYESVCGTREVSQQFRAHTTLLLGTDLSSVPCLAPMLDCSQLTPLPKDLWPSTGLLRDCFTPPHAHPCTQLKIKYTNNFRTLQFIYRCEKSPSTSSSCLNRSCGPRLGTGCDSRLSHGS